MIRFTVGAMALIVLGTSLVCGSPSVVAAQSQLWYFEPRRYYDPLRADVRAAQTNVFFGRSTPFEFYPDRSNFTGWDISLGMEIPILGWETESTRTGDFTQGGWGLGLWLPISWHMIGVLDDPDRSNPIINTDYRFSGVVKAQWMAWEHSSLQVRVAFGHESTHLGDEFSLIAVTNPDFRRINVSHEDLEYGVSFQHLHEIRGLRETEFLFRFKGMTPVSAGYYGAELRETGGGLVTQPSRRHQWGLEFQAVSELAWRPWVSVDVRDRIVYAYDRGSAGDREDTKLSVNALLGMRTTDLFVAPVTFDLYVRYYHGVNPAGQFRNDASYTLWGLGLLARLGGR